MLLPYIRPALAIDVASALVCFAEIHCVMDDNAVATTKGLAVAARLGAMDHAVIHGYAVDS